MRRALALVAMAMLGGCAPGKSIVTVTLDADASAPIGPISGLSVTASDSAGHADTIAIPVGATIPPAYKFSLRFDAGVKTTIHVAVVALDGNSQAIGTAAGDVAVKPSATAQLPLVLAPPVATTLAFTTQPSNAAVASSIKPPVQVSLEDASGNVVAGGAGFMITLALAANPSNAALGGTLTQPTVNGVATFSDLTVDTLGNGYTLSASASGLTAATSTPFNVIPAVWVPATNGIFGGSLNWMAFDPANGAIAYAATTSGVFKSTNGGASWIQINAGLSSRFVFVVAVDPFNSMRLLAGTTVGMFVSTNGGTSWAQASSGFDPTMESVRRIFFEPATADEIWMATDKPNVYRSQGAGISWSSMSNAATPGLPAARATGLGVDSAGNAYVSTFNNMGGAWKLAHNGTMWTQIGNPIPTNYIDSLVVDRASTPNVVWIGTDGTSATGLFKGDGTTFAAAATGLPLNFIEGIGIAKSNPQIMYVSGSDAGGDPYVYKSINGGGNWAPAATGLPTTTDFRPFQSTVAVDPTDPTHVLLPTPGGAFRTTNGGSSWAASESGLTGWSVDALTTEPGMTNLVVAGTGGGGIYRTVDGGTSWTAVAIGDKNVRFLAAANGKLYAGTTSLLAASVDHGVTWTTVAGTGTTNALAVSPSAPMTMYAAFGSSINISTDGGGTWGATAALAGAMPPTGLAVDSGNPMIVYTATFGTGIYRTANGGGSWGTANSGLTNLTARAVAVSPVTTTLVFAGTDGGIFRSSDGGSSWTLAGGTAGVSVRSFALHPTKANVGFAGSSSGVYQTIDGGMTWSLLNAGLDDTSVRLVTLDRNDPNVMWAGTASAGVFVARP